LINVDEKNKIKDKQLKKLLKQKTSKGEYNIEIEVLEQPVFVDDIINEVIAELNIELNRLKSNVFVDNFEGNFDSNFKLCDHNQH